ncbi:hypothetical protein JCM14076_22380 [Methylosoma difficile]
MSFRLKTILGIACIEACLLMALAISSLDYLRTSNQEELQRRAATVVTLLATATSDAVLSYDLARLEQLSADFLSNKGIVYVRVSDRDRVLVKAGDVTALQRAFHADSALESIDDGIYDTFKPIEAAGQQYGRVEIGLSTGSIQAYIDEARERIMMLAGLEMALVALFSWLLGSYLTRQLAGLESASKTIAQGDFSQPLKVRGRDELARVTNAFNCMAAQLGETYQALQLALASAKNHGERLQAVMDSELDGLIVTDQEGLINLFNHASERIFGYSAREVLGRHLNLLLVNPVDHLMSWSNMTNQAIGVVYEVQGRRKNGSVFHMDLSLTELHAVEEPGFIALVRDTTESKRIYDQLCASESMKKAMLETSLEAIVMIDKHDLICELNQSATRLFGYKQQEVLGEPMADLFISENYRRAHRLNLWRYVDTGEEHFFGRHYEIMAIRRSGQEFPIELSISPIHIGQEIFFSVFLRDITESKQAQQALRLGQEQAEQASLVKSQFLAMMSHEIRTPLNAILGTQELLADTPLDDQQKNYLQVANEAGNALLALVNDILDLTKVEAGRLVLELTDFDAEQVIKEVLRVVEKKAETKHLPLSYQVEPGLSTRVSGDPWRLRQVLLNLLTNAIKFTNQGHVTVYLSARAHTEADGLLQIDVIDTGIGIAKDTQARLFTVFTQADGSDTRRYGGSGLGLAICKSLVELWGGHIGVDSQEGVGSRFWFSFGDEPGVSVNKVVTSLSKPQPQVSVTRILLVEDSLVNQAVLSSFLKTGGHDVYAVDCGLAAIEAVKNQHFDLIFMDVSMPDMDGMEAARRIRLLGGIALKIPIIAITAHAVSGYREQCLAAGMNDYANKPITKAQLLDLVTKWRH